MHNFYLKNTGFFTQFSKILIYAVDPGGWAVLSRFGALLRKNNHEICCILEGWAKEHAEGSGLPLITGSFDSVIKENSRERILLMYGAQNDFKRNYEIVNKSKDAKWKLLFIFDSWKNHLINFIDQDSGTVYLPSAIAVIDDYQKEKLLHTLATQIPSKEIPPIHVLGHSALEADVEKIKNVSYQRQNELRRKFNAFSCTVVFALEPIRQDFTIKNKIFIGYDEYDALKIFFSLESIRGKKILILSHPRQNHPEIRQFLDREGFTKKFSAQLIENGSIEDFFSIADSIYGMTSICLNAAIEAGKEVFSIQPNRNAYGKTLSNPQLERCLIS